MTDDDATRGRVQTRRETLARLGAAALIFAPVRAAALACVATPAQTEGPFFVDTRLQRADLRGDPGGGPARAGLPLTLELAVSALSGAGCAPLAGAVVDVWHCDADGVYSGTRGAERYLRGYQVSDANGRVRFVTIYPGWYSGRAVHLHFKVRSGAHELASQLYFDDALSDRVFARAPYAARGHADVRNARDFLFRQGGRELTLAPVERDGGLAANFDLALKTG
ncbi:MAG: intradiol ring-cleavage dioxygenase [Betaproteobacteria bacterium]